MKETHTPPRLPPQFLPRLPSVMDRDAGAVCSTWFVWPFLYRPRPPARGWHLPHQSLRKRLPYRLHYRPILWRHFSKIPSSWIRLRSVCVKFTKKTTSTLVSVGNPLVPKLNLGGMGLSCVIGTLWEGSRGSRCYLHLVRKGILKVTSVFSLNIRAAWHLTKRARILCFAATQW